jgi:hypothetical protein
MSQIGDFSKTFCGYLVIFSYEITIALNSDFGDKIGATSTRL